MISCNTLIYYVKHTYIHTYIHIYIYNYILAFLLSSVLAQSGTNHELQAFCQYRFALVCFECNFSFQV